MQLSVAAGSNLPLTTIALVTAALVSAGIHLIYLTFNITLSSALSFSEDGIQDAAIRKAVVLCTSEKALPVTVAVLSQLTAAGGAAVGLAVIPCVMAHMLQIVSDSALVSWWNKRDARREMGEAAAGA